ncbi:hypothetical protein ACFQ16_23330 [Saccharopolyspora rosea]|uniref:Uncharacterized protein n=1 Tax=Saccharopolyspora rosea TaxID=524884 RepID=A0ABW3FVW8_9PSEU
MTRHGSVVASALVLSHDEQYERLAATTPEAVSAAVVGGDPCLDRMRASMGRRPRYRRALGADPGSRIVAVSSTWGDTSLFGRDPDLLADLLAELPDDHVVAAIFHPNTWYAHGPWQLRCWLGRCLRAGLRLVPPDAGWQQALIAADAVVGDHGAVTAYAAALGKPVLLGAFPDADVAAGSAVAALGGIAPRLDRRRSLAAQLHELTATPPDLREVGELASSVPGESAGILRRVCYELMKLDEPGEPALVAPYPESGLVPEHEPVRAWWVTGERTGSDVRLIRWPGDVQPDRGRDTVPPGRHLVVAVDHPRHDLRGAASILVHDLHDADDPDQLLAETLRAHPACAIAAAAGPGECRVLLRDGRRFTASVPPDTVDPAMCASAVRCWADAAPPAEFGLAVGTRTARVSLRSADH